MRGTIDQNLVDRLLPEIITLTSKSREPITVYIDSHGGKVASAELILSLLKSTNQNGDAPCHIITVAVSKASSAAADLLSSGDYAIAFQESTLLYHGARLPMPNPVTAEFATMLTESLKTSNDRYAMSLARKSEWRFMYLVSTLRGEFNKHRKETGNEAITDIQCFQQILRQKLSANAEKLLDQAITRWNRYTALFSLFEKKAERTRSAENLAAVEKVMLHASINFEYQQNKGKQEWTLRNGGLTRINDDFLLLGEYFQSTYSTQFRELCKRWAPSILTHDQMQELSSLDEAEAAKKKLELVRPFFQPFWSYFVALCHALQEAENELTPTDAFWLGLIDEPIGHPDLPLLRYFAEAQDESEGEPAPESKPASTVVLDLNEPQPAPPPKTPPDS